MRGQVVDCCAHCSRQIGVIGIQPGQYLAVAFLKTLVDGVGLPLVRFREPDQMVLVLSEDVQRPIG